VPAKHNHEPIEGKRIRLRLIDAADIETTRYWRNKDHIRKWFVHDGIIQPEQQKAWFEKYQLVDNDFVYIVESRGAKRWEPIGQISIYNIDSEKHTAEYGRLIAGEDICAGKGFFYEASKLMIDYWHRHHDIRTVTLEVKSDNSRAIHLYEQLGFTKDGEADGIVKMHVALSPEPATR
jgi:RimJ/RimL family protein N-acetyltransferase